MKKGFRILLLLMAVVFLASCGGQQEAGKEDPKQNTETVEEKKETEEKAEVPGSKDADFFGKWYLIAGKNPEGVNANERSEENPSLEIKEDNKAVMTFPGFDPDELTWERKDEKTLNLGDAEETIELTIEDGMIVGKSGEESLYFYKEGSEPSQLEKSLIEESAKGAEDSQ